MKIKMTLAFEKAVKKCHRKQIPLVENAIAEIANHPERGEPKKEDLLGVRVHKFHIHHQLTLLAYLQSDDEITLLSLGSHENFYRDLKKHT